MLSWHTAENPCLLLGVEVTPESWAGGVVVDWSGKWWQALTNPGKNGKPKKHREWLMESHHKDFGGRYLPYFTDGPPGYKTRADQIPPERWEFEPIYPRRGWAGASEAAIWEAVFGEGRYAYVGADILVDSAGVVTQCPPADNEGGPFIVANPAALILALQNAMTLQARLREGRE